MGDRPVRRTLNTAPLAARAAVALAALAGGAVVAVCTLAVHGRWWGLLLGLAATLATLWAVPDRWWGRTSYAAGWAATVVLATGGRSEGDYVLASDLGGYTVLATVILVTIAGVLALRPRRPPVVRDSGSAGTAS